MGSAKPYQKSASRGIVATARHRPALVPRYSSQPAHETISITTKKAPSCAANRSGCPVSYQGPPYIGKALEQPRHPAGLEDIDEDGDGRKPEAGGGRPT